MTDRGERMQPIDRSSKRPGLRLKPREGKRAMPFATASSSSAAADVIYTVKMMERDHVAPL